MDASGFPFIHGIFYSEFHPKQGPKVVYEVPEGLTMSSKAIAPSASQDQLKIPISANMTQQEHQSLPILMSDSIENLREWRLDHYGSSVSIGNNDAKQQMGRMAPRVSSLGLLEPYLDFDSISDYIIPKPDLCDRLVSICTPFYKVMGYPVLMEDSKYERNGLLFNLCLVFERNVSTACYEQVVRKLGRILRSLEVTKNMRRVFQFDRVDPNYSSMHWL